MGIKKLNAWLGIGIILLLIIHLGYEVWSYIAFFYNPLVTAVIGYGFAVFVGLHVILSLYGVYAKNDGKAMPAYPGLNKRTIIQRASAAAILVMFPIHVKTGDWISHHSQSVWLFFLLVALELLFFTALYLHVLTSFSRALISLGFLSDRARQKKIDIAVGVLFHIVILGALYVIIPTQWFLFNMGG